MYTYIYRERDIVYDYVYIYIYIHVLYVYIHIGGWRLRSARVRVPGVPPARDQSRRTCAIELCSVHLHVYQYNRVFIAL